MVFVANNETTGAGMLLLPGTRFDDGDSHPGAAPVSVEILPAALQLMG